MARTLTKAAVPSDRLAAVLAGFDDERLEGLLAARPDLLHPPPADFAALAARARGWSSVYACYRGLDLWCQQVVQALCLLPVSASMAELCALLGPEVATAELAPAIERLADLGLLMRDGDSLELVGAFQQLPEPAGLGPPASVVLGAQSQGQLAAIARRLGASPGATRAATLGVVAAVLADAGRVQEVLRAAPAGAAELMRRVAEEGPTAVVPGGLYGVAVSERHPVGWLLSRGLLTTSSWSTVVMPREVGLALRRGRPFKSLANQRPELEPVAVGVEVVDATAGEAALRLVADVATILEDWSALPAKLLKAGGLGMRDLRRAAKAVGRGEVEVARIVDLAAAAGLVAVDLSSDTPLPTATYDDWLALDPASRWQRLAAGWLASPLHLGLAGETGAKDKPIPPLLVRGVEPEAARRRAAVLSVLASVAPGEAVSSADLRARLEWECPMLWSGGPGPASMMMEWVVEEAELVGLGAGRGLSTAGRLAAQGRFEEARAALASQAPPVSSSFVVQADLTLVAPGELAVPVRTEIELLADVESKGAAAVYRLSEASLRRGFDAGRGAEQILAFLDEHASRPVPQSLRYLVGDLGRRFGRVRVGPARCYVRCDDPSLLAEVARTRRTARVRLRLLAPTVAVSEAEPEAVLAALRDAGHLPAHEDADGVLVLTAPERRRAPACSGRGQHGGPRSVGPEVADLAPVVARLRRAPAPPPATGRKSKKAAAEELPSPPPPPPSQPGIFEELSRPIEIFKGPEQVADLLAQAFVEDWTLRVAYTNRRGRSSQLNLVPLAAPGSDVLVEVLPQGEMRTLDLGRIEWARVMTEAEEDHLYS